MDSLYIILSIGVGGGLGALTRFMIGRQISRRVANHPHLGTLAANLLGCFLIALFTRFFVHSPLLHLGLVTGYCGALTTFSSFSLDNVALLSQRRFQELFLNLGISCSLGIGITAMTLWALGALH